MTDIKLRPCPFCNSTNLDCLFHMNDPREKRRMEFYCRDCGAQGPYVKGYDGYAGSSFPLEALELWNTRPIEDALNSRIAELEAKLAAAEQNALKWVEYNGSDETLPKIGADILFFAARFESIQVAFLSSYGKFCIKNVGVTVPTPGDRWAYLPTMEDAS